MNGPSRWIASALVGAAAFAANVVAASALLHAAGLSLTHDIPYVDSAGASHEGGFTRAALVSGLVASGAGAWAGFAFHVRRLDAGIEASDWRLLGLWVAALATYASAMAVLAAAFEREARHAPRVLFGAFDLLVLVICGAGAFNLSHKMGRG